MINAQREDILSKSLFIPLFLFSLYLVGGVAQPEERQSPEPQVVSASLTSPII